MEKQVLEFQKEYLRLVGEEQPPVITTEMEKIVRELPGDPKIVALFKRISDGCMIARPCDFCARLNTN